MDFNDKVTFCVSFCVRVLVKIQIIQVRTDWCCPNTVDFGSVIGGWEEKWLK